MNNELSKVKKLAEANDSIARYIGIYRSCYSVEYHYKVNFLVDTVLVELVITSPIKQICDCDASSFEAAILYFEKEFRELAIETQNRKIQKLETEITSKVKELQDDLTDERKLLEQLQDEADSERINHERTSNSQKQD